MNIQEADAMREELYKRLFELNRRIAAAQQWGSILTALDEERRGVRRAIKSLEQRFAEEK